MEKMEATFLLILVAITMQTCCMATTSSSSSSASTTKMYVKFIKSQCNVTTYPSLCNKALSPQASKVKTNPQALCYAAMSVAVQAARNASATVEKQLKKVPSASGKAAVKDCIDELGDIIDELNSSMKEIGSIRNAKSSNEVQYHMDNMKTWVSAAITDEGTCTDELEEEGVIGSARKKINKSIKTVAQHTTNVLCLVNHLKY